jgi:Gas vesicle protein
MTGVVEPGYRRSTGLVDVLDRVLDKGLVIAGDIRVSLAEVELLTIRIRLLVCSIDKAEQIGLDWWRQDPALSVGARKLALENEALREQVRALEERVAALATAPDRTARPARPGRTRRNSGGRHAG